MMNYLIILAFILPVIGLIYYFRNGIVAGLLKFRAQLQIRSLRTAIKEADADKAETGRKNMVVFNTVSQQFEPLQKRVLKAAANASKNKSNKAMTDGRKKMMTTYKKKRYISPDMVKKVEKKSLYVTN